MRGYIDHSQIKTDQSTNYDEFYNLSDLAIMFCAGKFREGSDIPNLSCCIFLDEVVNRGIIPFIQCIGRVLRIDTDNLKKNGHILDGLVRTGENNKCMIKSIVDKLIGYYVDLYDLSRSEFEFEDQDDQKVSDRESKADQFVRLVRTLAINPKNKRIIINLKNNRKTTIDVAELNLSCLEWSLLIPQFNKVLKKMIVMSDYDEYRAIQKYCIDLGITDKYQYQTEYQQHTVLQKTDNRGNHQMLDIRARFPGYFKNWYDFLGICTNGTIQLLDYWRRECKSRGIMNAIQYMELCERDGRFPNMPDEFYKGFTTLEYEFNNVSTIGRR